MYYDVVRSMGSTKEARELREIKETSRKTWMVLCELAGRGGLLMGEVKERKRG